MSWGTSRRNTVLFVIFIFIFVPIAGIAFMIYYNPPNCFDSKMNGDETGADCGGSCELLCTNQVTEPVILWERHFKVNEGVYNLLAYIENPNPTAFVRDAQYIFKIYNEENILIGEKKGVVSIAPKSVRPVIESNIQTYEQVPSRIDFEFTSELVYEQTSPKESIVIIKDEYLENESKTPRIKAQIQNISLRQIRSIDVVVLVYDVFDNVMNTSSTFVERLNPEEDRDIIFTWPQPFPDTVARIELIPLYDFE